jgi:hypothetical protein
MFTTSDWQQRYAVHHAFTPVSPAAEMLAAGYSAQPAQCGIYRDFTALQQTQLRDPVLENVIRIIRQAF